MLRSPVPSVQAWGAWLAAQAGAMDLVPELQRVAERHRDSSMTTDQIVSGAALDALIQMRAEVPAWWARLFFDRRPAETLVLLSRADAAEDALAHLVSSQKGIPWFAAANLLLKMRSSRLAPHLLRDLEIEAVVTIVSDSSAGISCDAGLGAVSAGHGGMGLMPGFPPLAHYYLSSGNLGGTLLSNGPRAVFYFRSVSQPGSTPAATVHDWGGPSSEEKLSYVAALLGSFGQRLIVSATEPRRMVWRNHQDTEAEITAHREDILKRFRLLVSQLVEANVLSADDATAIPPPRIAITVRDRR
jgi:hypothetical protein